MADSKEKLFSDFPAVSTEQWMEKITADLKGADFEKKLVWRTNEGFKVKPFYRQEDLEGLKTTEGLPGEFPYVRGTKKNDNTWFVRQEIKVECPKEGTAANRTAGAGRGLSGISKCQPVRYLSDFTVSGRLCTGRSEADAGCHWTRSPATEP